MCMANKGDSDLASAKLQKDIALFKEQYRLALGIDTSKPLASSHSNQDTLGVIQCLGRDDVNTFCLSMSRTSAGINPPPPMSRGSQESLEEDLYSSSSTAELDSDISMSAASTDEERASDCVRYKCSVVTLAESDKPRAFTDSSAIPSRPPSLDNSSLSSPSSLPSPPLVSFLSLSVAASSDPVRRAPLPAFQKTKSPSTISFPAKGGISFATSSLPQSNADRQIASEDLTHSLPDAKIKMAKEESLKLPRDIDGLGSERCQFPKIEDQEIISSAYTSSRIDSLPDPRLVKERGLPKRSLRVDHSMLKDEVGHGSNSLESSHPAVNRRGSDVFITAAATGRANSEERPRNVLLSAQSFEGEVTATHGVSDKIVYTIPMAPLGSIKSRLKLLSDSAIATHVVQKVYTEKEKSFILESKQKSAKEAQLTKETAPRVKLKHPPPVLPKPRKKHETALEGDEDNAPVKDECRADFPGLTADRDSKVCHQDEYIRRVTNNSLPDLISSCSDSRTCQTETAASVEAPGTARISDSSNAENQPCSFQSDHENILMSSIASDSKDSSSPLSRMETDGAYHRCERVRSVDDQSAFEAEYDLDVNSAHLSTDEHRRGSDTASRSAKLLIKTVGQCHRKKPLLRSQSLDCQNVVTEEKAKSSLGRRSSSAIPSTGSVKSKADLLACNAGIVVQKAYTDKEKAFILESKQKAAKDFFESKNAVAKEAQRRQPRVPSQRDKLSNMINRFEIFQKFKSPAQNVTPAREKSVPKSKADTILNSRKRSVSTDTLVKDGISSPKDISSSLVIKTSLSEETPKGEPISPSLLQMSIHQETVSYSRKVRDEFRAESSEERNAVAIDDDKEKQRVPTPRFTTNPKAEAPGHRKSFTGREGDEVRQKVKARAIDKEGNETDSPQTHNSPIEERVKDEIGNQICGDITQRESNVTPVRRHKPGSLLEIRIISCENESGGEKFDVTSQRGAVDADDECSAHDALVDENAEEGIVVGGEESCVKRSNGRDFKIAEETFDNRNDEGKTREINLTDDIKNYEIGLADTGDIKNYEIGLADTDDIKNYEIGLADTDDIKKYEIGLADTDDIKNYEIGLADTDDIKNYEIGLADTGDKKKKKDRTLRTIANAAYASERKEERSVEMRDAEEDNDNGEALSEIIKDEESINNRHVASNINETNEVETKLFSEIGTGVYANHHKEVGEGTEIGKTEMTKTDQDDCMESHRCLGDVDVNEGNVKTATRSEPSTEYRTEDDSETKLDSMETLGENFIVSNYQNQNNDPFRMISSPSPPSPTNGNVERAPMRLRVSLSQEINASRFNVDEDVLKADESQKQRLNPNGVDYTAESTSTDTCDSVCRMKYSIGTVRREHSEALELVEIASTGCLPHTQTLSDSLSLSTRTGNHVEGEKTKMKTEIQSDWHANDNGLDDYVTSKEDMGSLGTVLEPTSRGFEPGNNNNMKAGGGEGVKERSDKEQKEGGSSENANEGDGGKVEEIVGERVDEGGAADVKEIEEEITKEEVEGVSVSIDSHLAAFHDAVPSASGCRSMKRDGLKDDAIASQPAKTMNPTYHEQGVVGDTEKRLSGECAPENGSDSTYACKEYTGRITGRISSRNSVTDIGKSLSVNTNDDNELEDDDHDNRIAHRDNASNNNEERLTSRTFLTPIKDFGHGVGEDVENINSSTGIPVTHHDIHHHGQHSRGEDVNSNVRNPDPRDHHPYPNSDRHLHPDPHRHHWSLRLPALTPPPLRKTDPSIRARTPGTARGGVVKWTVEEGRLEESLESPKREEKVKSPDRDGVGHGALAFEEVGDCPTRRAELEQQQVGGLAGGGGLGELESRDVTAGCDSGGEQEAGGVMIHIALPVHGQACRKGERRRAAIGRCFFKDDCSSCCVGQVGDSASSSDGTPVSGAFFDDDNEEETSRKSAKDDQGLLQSQASDSNSKSYSTYSVNGAFLSGAAGDYFPFVKGEEGEDCVVTEDFISRDVTKEEEEEEYRKRVRENNACYVTDDGKFVNERSKDSSSCVQDESGYRIDNNDCGDQVKRSVDINDKATSDLDLEATTNASYHSRRFFKDTEDVDCVDLVRHTDSPRNSDVDETSVAHFADSLQNVVEDNIVAWPTDSRPVRNVVEDDNAVLSRTNSPRNTVDGSFVAFRNASSQSVLVDQAYTDSIIPDFNPRLERTPDNISNLCDPRDIDNHQRNASLLDTSPASGKSDDHQWTSLTEERLAGYVEPDGTQSDITGSFHSGFSESCDSFHSAESDSNVNPFDRPSWELMQRDYYDVGTTFGSAIENGTEGTELLFDSNGNINPVEHSNSRDDTHDTEERVASSVDYIHDWIDDGVVVHQPALRLGIDNQHSPHRGRFGADILQTVVSDSENNHKEIPSTSSAYGRPDAVPVVLAAPANDYQYLYGCFGEPDAWSCFSAQNEIAFDIGDKRNIDYDEFTDRDAVGVGTSFELLREHRHEMKDKGAETFLKDIHKDVGGRSRSRDENMGRINRWEAKMESVQSHGEKKEKVDKKNVSLKNIPTDGLSKPSRFDSDNTFCPFADVRTRQTGVHALETDMTHSDTCGDRINSFSSNVCVIPNGKYNTVAFGNEIGDRRGFPAFDVEEEPLNRLDNVLSISTQRHVTCYGSDVTPSSESFEVVYTTSGIPINFDDLVDPCDYETFRTCFPSSKSNSTMAQSEVNSIDNAHAQPELRNVDDKDKSKDRLKDDLKYSGAEDGVVNVGAQNNLDKNSDASSQPTGPCNNNNNNNNNNNTVSTTKATTIVTKGVYELKTFSAVLSEQKDVFLAQHVNYLERKVADDIRRLRGDSSSFNRNISNGWEWDPYPLEDDHFSQPVPGDDDDDARDDCEEVADDIGSVNLVATSATGEVPTDGVDIGKPVEDVGRGGKEETALTGSKHNDNDIETREEGQNFVEIKITGDRRGDNEIVVRKTEKEAADKERLEREMKEEEEKELQQTERQQRGQNQEEEKDEKQVHGGHEGAELKQCGQNEEATISDNQRILKRREKEGELGFKGDEPCLRLLYSSRESDEANTGNINLGSKAFNEYYHGNNADYADETGQSNLLEQSGDSDSNETTMKYLALQKRTTLPEADTSDSEDGYGDGNDVDEEEEGHMDFLASNEDLADDNCRTSNGLEAEAICLTSECVDNDALDSAGWELIEDGEGTLEEVEESQQESSYPVYLSKSIIDIPTALKMEEDKNRERRRYANDEEVEEEEEEEDDDDVEVEEEGDEEEEEENDVEVEDEEEEPLQQQQQQQQQQQRGREEEEESGGTCQLASNSKTLEDETPFLGEGSRPEGVETEEQGQACVWGGPERGQSSNNRQAQAVDLDAGNELETFEKAERLLSVASPTPEEIDTFCNSMGSRSPTPDVTDTLSNYRTSVTPDTMDTVSDGMASTTPDTMDAVSDSMAYATPDTMDTGFDTMASTTPDTTDTGSNTMAPHTPDAIHTTYQSAGSNLFGQAFKKAAEYDGDVDALYDDLEDEDDKCFVVDDGMDNDDFDDDDEFDECYDTVEECDFVIDGGILKSRNDSFLSDMELYSIEEEDEEEEEEDDDGNDDEEEKGYGERDDFHDASEMSDSNQDGVISLQRDANACRSGVKRCVSWADENDNDNVNNNYNNYDNNNNNNNSISSDNDLGGGEEIRGCLYKEYVQFRRRRCTADGIDCDDTIDKPTDVYNIDADDYKRRSLSMDKDSLDDFDDDTEDCSASNPDVGIELVRFSESSGGAQDELPQDPLDELKARAKRVAALRAASVPVLPPDAAVPASSSPPTGLPRLDKNGCHILPVSIFSHSSATSRVTTSIAAASASTATLTSSASTSAEPPPPWLVDLNDIKIEVVEENDDCYYGYENEADIKGENRNEADIKTDHRLTADISLSGSNLEGPRFKGRGPNRGKNKPQVADSSTCVDFDGSSNSSFEGKVAYPVTPCKTGPSTNSTDTATTTCVGSFSETSPVSATATAATSATTSSKANASNSRRSSSSNNSSNLSVKKNNRSKSKKINKTAVRRSFSASASSSHLPSSTKTATVATPDVIPASQGNMAEGGESAADVVEVLLESPNASLHRISSETVFQENAVETANRANDPYKMLERSQSDASLLKKDLERLADDDEVHLTAAESSSGQNISECNRVYLDLSRAEVFEKVELGESNSAMMRTSSGRLLETIPQDEELKTGDLSYVYASHRSFSTESSSSMEDLNAYGKGKGKDSSNKYKSTGKGQPDNNSSLASKSNLKSSFQIYSHSLKQKVRQLQMGSLPEQLNALTELNVLMEQAWSMPVYGKDLAYELCDILRTESALDIIVGNVASNNKELMKVSARLLEQSLTTSNRRQLAENGLELVVKMTHDMLGNCELAQTCTGILESLFKTSEETCSMVIKLGGLDVITYWCRCNDRVTLKNCAIALSNLALYGGGENQQEMTKHKVPEWLFPLAFVEDDSVRYYALLAIGVLVSNKEIENDVISSGTLALVLPFVDSHDPAEFAQRDTSHRHGRSPGWLKRLIPVLASKREEAQSLAAFHFVMEAGIKSEQGRKEILYKIGAVEPLKWLASTPNRVASRLAGQALKIIGEEIPHKLSQQVPLWTSDDVAYWIAQVGFSAYVDVFQACQIDGDLLLRLSEEDLRESLDMPCSVTRKRFLRELRDLKISSDYTSCDPSMLGSWLRNVGEDMAQYTYQMLHAGLDRPLLGNISNQHLLEDCGVANGIHRMKILSKIEEFRALSPTIAPFDDIGSVKTSSGSKPPIDVFISYRRSNGSQLASLLKVHLQLRGFTVFIDIERLRAGKFDEGLLESVKNAKNFIIVLTQNSLDRCMGDDQKKDWVHREIVAALDAGPKIIPIMDNFRWPSPDSLPEDMRNLVYFNGIRWIHDYQDACVDKLESFLRGDAVQPHFPINMNGPCTMNSNGNASTPTSGHPHGPGSSSSNPTTRNAHGTFESPHSPPYQRAQGMSKHASVDVESPTEA